MSRGVEMISVGSEAEIVLAERYDNLYLLVPVVWMPGGEAVYFARMRVGIQNGGAFIPAFSGRYSELYRLHVASGEFQKVFPSYDVPVCNRCISDVSSDGHWLAYHGEDGSLVLRDLVSGGEMLVADASNACYLGSARFSPDGGHLVYVALDGPCDEQDAFDVARAVMVDVPFEGQSRVLAESTEAVDWPVGWLDGRPSAPEDLVPRILIGVVRPSPTGTSEGESDR
jgi:hypothetical protein